MSIEGVSVVSKKEKLKFARTIQKARRDVDLGQKLEVRRK